LLVEINSEPSDPGRRREEISRGAVAPPSLSQAWEREGGWGESES
jgi:hypothetical protein